MAAGTANLRLRRWGRAAAHLRVAVAAKPDFAQAWSNLAFAHLELQQLDAAGAAADRAVALDARLAAAWNLRGLVLERRGNLEGARADYERALGLHPDFANAHVNRANIDQAQGRLDAARAGYERACALDASLAEAHYNLGHLHHKTARVEDSLEPYRRAIAARADYAQAHHNLAHALLLLGRFDEAWPESAWRQARLAFVDARARDGRPYSLPTSRDRGVLTIVGEQGLGDVVFFLRFAPRLRELGWRLRFTGSSRLGPMLRRTGLFEDVVAEGAEVTGHEILAGDLPLLAGDGQAHVPPPLPLTADPSAVESMRVRLAAAGPPPYVALAWRAGTPQVGPLETLFKELPPQALGAALRGIEATFVSVQRDPRAEDAAAIAAAIGRPVHDFSATNVDLEEALALMALAECSVGVSNTLVHLRAGLGRDGDVLVPFPPEWRWMDGGDSPWFPSFSVHRQDGARRWDDALAQLAAAVSRKVSSARTGSSRPNSSP